MSPVGFTSLSAPKLLPSSLLCQKVCTWKTAGPFEWRCLPYSYIQRYFTFSVHSWRLACSIVYKIIFLLFLLPRLSIKHLRHPLGCFISQQNVFKRWWFKVLALLKLTIYTALKALPWGFLAGPHPQCVWMQKAEWRWDRRHLFLSKQQNQVSVRAHQCFSPWVSGGMTFINLIFCLTK